MRRGRWGRGALALPLALALLSTVGCGTKGSPRVHLRVLAASSLTGALPQLAHDFEAAHPGVSVEVSFAGSATLVAQVLAGAPADVVVTASPATGDRVAAAGLADGPAVTIARNRLTLVVRTGSSIGSLAEAAQAGVRLVVCAPAVPCGAAAASAAKAAGVALHPVSETSDVKAVLSSVELGEADAGLVYVTDALAAGGRVREVALPSGQAAETTYPAVVVAHRPHRDLAVALVALLAGPQGQDVLRRSGFLPPP